MDDTLVGTIYDRADQIVRDRFEYSNVPQEEINAFRDGLIRGMEEMHETMSNSSEEFYKWYPIDDSCYWTDWDISLKDEIGSENLPRISTIVTDGSVLYTYEECNFGWSTMSKMGWKYMRIKLD